MTERRIVCAACRHPDGRMVLGVRHFDNLMWQQILSVSALDKVQGQIPDEVFAWNKAEQGFVDNRGEFLSREDAWPIAAEQQILNDPGWQPGCLHSEHLY